MDVRIDKVAGSVEWILGGLLGLIAGSLGTATTLCHATSCKEVECRWEMGLKLFITQFYLPFIIKRRCGYVRDRTWLRRVPTTNILPLQIMSYKVQALFHVGKLNLPIQCVGINSVIRNQHIPYTNKSLKGCTITVWK